MPTLPNMGIITPTLGGDSGTWDDKINAALGLVDPHDHTAGKGVLVPVAGLNINADFAMGGHAVTGLGSIAFNAVAALATGSKRLFVSSADNELYWRTNAGTNVKLTSGTSINTTLVGGITGDYSTVGAAVAYDDSNKRYTFKTQTGTWARLASGPVRIYEYNTSESVYVEQAVDAALAAPYTVTWPAAPPGATSLMQIDAAGVMSFGNVLPTITDNIALSANKGITLSGTGVYHHGTLSRTQAFVPAAQTAGAAFTTGTDGAGNLSPCILAASSTVHADVKGFEQADIISAITVYNAQLTGAGSMTYDVFLQRPSSAIYTSLLSAPVTSAAASVTLTFASGHTVVGGDIIWVAASCPAANTWSIYSMGVAYSR